MYEIRNGPAVKSDFTFYGGARKACICRASEVMLHGPAETGKTFSILQLLHLFACKYSKASIVIMRKTQTSCYSTVVKMFVEKVIVDELETGVVTKYGGEQPRWFDYPANRSKIWVAGMDKSSRILSAEHDIIFWCQAEEADIEEWEYCTTRTTGRAGNMPFGQTIGDMNPTYPQHWPYHRESLKLFHSKHVENPTLFDPVTKVITEQGEKTLGVLRNLTGARRTRLLEGKAAQVEGAIYTEWDDAVNLIYKKDLPTMFRYVAGIDWGYRKPGVLGVWGIDGRNGAMHLVAEIYFSLRTDDWWLDKALELHEDFSRARIVRGGKHIDYLIEAWVCDPSEPAYIEKFRRAGLNAVAGYNAVMPGITAVKTRMKNETLKICRTAPLLVDPVLNDVHQPLCTKDEIPGYVWADKQAKEIPVKERDHGMDQMRYAVCYVDEIGRESIKKAGAWGSRK